MPGPACSTSWCARRSTASAASSPTSPPSMTSFAFDRVRDPRRQRRPRHPDAHRYHGHDGADDAVGHARQDAARSARPGPCRPDPRRPRLWLRCVLPAPGVSELGERRSCPPRRRSSRQSFATTRSARRRARWRPVLNAEAVPGPDGRPWIDTTIRGQVDRGTGILNNTLYIGRLVWNRCSYVKDPRTGKRVARLNPPEQYETVEVPDLRIVDDELWQAVKARQRTPARDARCRRQCAERDAPAAVPAQRAADLRLLRRRLHHHRRGPLRLRDAARQGHLRQRSTIARQHIEARVLGALHAPHADAGTGRGIRPHLRGRAAGHAAGRDTAACRPGAAVGRHRATAAGRVAGDRGRRVERHAARTAGRSSKPARRRWPPTSPAWRDPPPTVALHPKAADPTAAKVAELEEVAERPQRSARRQGRRCARSSARWC